VERWVGVLWVVVLLQWSEKEFLGELVSLAVVLRVAH